LRLLYAALAAGVALSAPAATGCADEAQRLSAAEARGKVIYTTGRSESGALTYFRLLSAGDRLLPAKGVVCANCHGSEGKGGREGNVVIADISNPTLARLMTAAPPRNRARAAYTDVLLARAITEGIDASGRGLDGAMPRWVMQESDLQDLLQYLKRLGRD
jgi:mono/diheme cytochrome c family protein